MEPTTTVRIMIVVYERREAKAIIDALLAAPPEPAPVTKVTTGAVGTPRKSQAASLTEWIAETDLQGVH
jgi:hypothetical protein